MLQMMRTLPTPILAKQLCRGNRGRLAQPSATISSRPLREVLKSRSIFRFRTDRNLRQNLIWPTPKWRPGIRTGGPSGRGPAWQGTSCCWSTATWRWPSRPSTGTLTSASNCRCWRGRQEGWIRWQNSTSANSRRHSPQQPRQQPPSLHFSPEPGCLVVCGLQEPQSLCRLTWVSRYFPPLPFSRQPVRPAAWTPWVVWSSPPRSPRPCQDNPPDTPHQPVHRSVSLCPYQRSQNSIMEDSRRIHHVIFLELRETWEKSEKQIKIYNVLNPMVVCWFCSLCSSVQMRRPLPAPPGRVVDSR